MQENPVKGSIKCISENMLPTISSRIKKKKKQKSFELFLMKPLNVRVTQLTFSRSTSTIETLEERVKYIQR